MGEIFRALAGAGMIAVSVVLGGCAPGIGEAPIPTVELTEAPLDDPAAGLARTAEHERRLHDVPAACHRHLLDRIAMRPVSLSFRGLSMTRKRG